MTATLRYDIGEGATAVLSRYEGSIRTAAETYERNFDRSLLAEIGAIHTVRWGGSARGWSNHVVTFAIKLPKQVELAYLLLYRSYWLARDIRIIPPGVMPNVVNGQSARSLGTLANKLSISLGLDNVDRINRPDVFLFGEEDAFTQAIHEAPGDLSSWMAYADWLSERENEEMRCRGRVIAGWLGKKALKMKYGVPIIAQPKKWSWLQEGT